jgi:hypothetical protein
MKLLSRLWKSESKHEPELTLEARRAAQRAADSIARDENPTPESSILPEQEPPLVARVEESSGDAGPVHGGPESVQSDHSIEAERTRALIEPIYLANEVLGFELQPEHMVLLDALIDKRFNDTLVLWPRGAGKTTCLVVTIVRELLRNPNLRIVYTTADSDLAKRRFAQVADIFRNPSEKFQKLFPTVVMDTCKGSEFILAGRSNPAISEPSFFATPIGAINTGSRFDLLIVDDVVNDANVHSELSRSNTVDRYQNFRGVRSADARLILSGTMYHPDDLYARISNWAKTDPDSTWRIERHSCWAFKCAGCGHKDIFHSREGCRLCQKAGQSCPQFEIGEETVLIDRIKTKSGAVLGYTIEGLNLERGPTRMGLKTFRLQMELDARPEAAAEWPKFTKEFLRERTIDATNLNLKSVFIVADLGLRGSVTNANPNPARLVNTNDHDPSVFMAIAMHGHQAIPIDCDAGSWSAAELAQHVFEFLKRHRGSQPIPFYSENFGAWASIKLNIATLAERENIPIDLRDLGISNIENAKLHRIAALHSAMVAGRVALPTYLPNLAALCPQLLAFPFQVNGHDDFADCLSLVPLALDSGIEATTAHYNQLAGRSSSSGPWSGGDRPLCMADPAEWRRWNESRHDDDDGFAGLCTG